MSGMEKTRAFLQKCIDEGRIPGAAWAVVTKKHVWVDWLGNRQIVEETKPVERNTVYDLASLTKVICTTTLALQMMEKGLIYLQMPVKAVLSDFPWENITVGQLLTHTSGMKPDDKKYKAVHGRDGMYHFLTSLPLDYEPGTDLKYSDFGFITMGRILEETGGESLDALADERIFSPLGMKDTCFKPAENGLEERCAATEIEEGRGLILGEVHDGKAWRMGGVSGHAGLFSTVDDLSLFVQMMLGNGEREGTRVLSPASIELLKIYRTEGMGQRRTIGWFADDHINASCGDFSSDQCLYHTGFAGGSVYIDFRREMGVILLTNAVHPHRDHTNMNAIRNAFHNIVLSSFDDQNVCA